MKTFCAKVFSTVFSAVICISAARIPSQRASADSEIVPITGQCYMFSGDCKYNFTDSESIGDTKTVDKLGKLELKADVQRSYIDEMDITAFEIADDTKLELTFTYDNTLRDADEDLWHICSDDSKTINGVDIGAEIKKGAVILQTSYDAEHWGTAQDHVKTNILGSGDETTHTIVFESDSYNNQLMNGCYYRLIVAYKLEKKTPSWPRDDTEHKKRAQVYTFYAGYKDARKEPDPNLKKYSYSDFMKTDLDKGYVNEQMIDGNDPHNGWKLGRFVISGFTQRNEDEEHTFIKTSGDKMILEFALEQDIYQLNGKQNLVISDDTNGSDPAFSVEKSKNGFGHGTLLVRFTDYTGDQFTQVYNNFLEASCSPGANTRIQLCEEGDYEVALDYEVLNKSKGSYMNYKMAYNFRVRNGNCMIFAYDNDNNMELANNSFATNGFTLNLAQSHYLTINVKHDVYTQGEDGYTLDTRSSKPGKEKDKVAYTEPGVYTITVTNPYTTDQVEKTIYVGSDMNLVAYINPNNHGYSV